MSQAMEARTRETPDVAGAFRIVDLAVEGMRCAGCAGRVDRILSAVPGVEAVAVNLATERARVQVAVPDRHAGTRSDGARSDGPRSDSRGDQVLADAVTGAGYKASVLARDRPAARTAIPVWPVAGALTGALPLAASMTSSMLGGPVLIPLPLQFAIASVVQFVFGAPFYRGAWRSIRAGGADMDVLVVLGSTVAWAASTVAMLDPGAHAARMAGADVSFATAALIIAFVRLGKYLETGARRATASVLGSLGSLRPEHARIRRDGTTRRVALDLVAVGAEVEVRAGERVPVDGEIIEGSAGIDLSLLTGESLPVERGAGDLLPAGALVTDATVVLAARAVGEGTTLERIVRRIEGAVASKAPVERLVDRVAGIFVPVILGLAALGFLAHLAFGDTARAALSVAVATLVVACPCALGLATPVAILVGTGNGARRGILFKDAASLERGRRIARVAFDKTGTLTQGRPEIREIVPAAGVTPGRLLAVAAALQSGSAHPIAGAIRAHAEEAGLAGTEDEPGVVDELRVVRGRGITGRVGGRRALVGNADLLAAHGIALGALEDSLARCQAAGSTIVLVAMLDPAPSLLGILGLADRARDEAAAVVAALRAQGIAVAMLTGDGEAAAATTARALGITEVHAGLLPDDKAALLASWREAGIATAMVGDGINDGPALATASLGIAMAGGTDLAIEAADVALLRPDLRLVPQVFATARRTASTIRRGLFWAFAYNAVGIPLALAGIIPPAFAAAAMALSSISVVGNALLARDGARFEPGTRS